MENKELYDKVAENAFNEIYVNWDDKVKEAYELYLEAIKNK